ncbi:hypothetical protein JOC85_001261 [Bacillus mesophilus]|uniref:Uncharacterized protein n=1 Tax=Bacillus mesophilus TaxID=1808955 RepID=A0A6M0Q8X3_9BACI|nr:hypothetical protein [Bacillus mesophilus]MBM7660489.1 hypothetical protein [Bacillus mesophilus]NEY71960.1 hypothetical protein [Bacillus mesophilus]
MLTEDQIYFFGDILFYGLDLLIYTMLIGLIIWMFTKEAKEVRRERNQMMKEKGYSGVMLEGFRTLINPRLLLQEIKKTHLEMKQGSKLRYYSIWLAVPTIFIYFLFLFLYIQFLGPWLLRTI